MNALPLLPVVAFLKFSLYMLMVWFAVVRLVPRLRTQVIFMSCWGGVGGVLAGAWHRQDFWNPPTVWGYPDGSPLLTAEDFLFGLAFAGIASVLFLLVTAMRLEEGLPNGVQVSRPKKIVALFAPFGIGFAFYLSGLNSIVSGGAVFLIGTVAICLTRRDLLWSAILGSLFVAGFYVFLLGLFLKEQPNSAELARDLCQFYVRNGAVKTSQVLLWWALTYGAWMTVLYPFITNKRLVGGRF